MYYLLDENGYELDRGEDFDRLWARHKLNPGSKIVDREGLEIGKLENRKGDI